MTTRTKAELPKLYRASRGISGSIHHTEHFHLDESEASETAERLAGYWENHPAARGGLLSDCAEAEWTEAEAKVLRALLRAGRERGEVWLTNRKDSVRPEQLYRLESLGVLRVREISQEEMRDFGLIPDYWGRERKPRLSDPHSRVSLTPAGRAWLYD